jgi:hypothetical protein
MKFATNNKTCNNLNIGYDDKTVEQNSLAYKLMINWKKRTEHITPKLSSVCYALP